MCIYRLQSIRPVKNSRQTLSSRCSLMLESMCRIRYVCCSVLQCVAVCRSVLQCVAVCRSMLPCVACVALCCSVRPGGVGHMCVVLQCDAFCCNVLLFVAHFVTVCCRVRMCTVAHVHVAVCCSVLQCVAVCCSVLQCVAVYCITSSPIFNHESSNPPKEPQESVKNNPYSIKRALYSTTRPAIPQQSLNNPWKEFCTGWPRRV